MIKTAWNNILQTVEQLAGKKKQHGIAENMFIYIDKENPNKHRKQKHKNSNMYRVVKLEYY